MDAGDVASLAAVAVALIALYVSWRSMDAAWVAARATEASAETARDVQHKADAPAFEAQPDTQPGPTGWGITVTMTGGPPRIEVRWVRQIAEVTGPVHSGGSDTTMLDPQAGGPLLLSQGERFRVVVECDANTVSMDALLSIDSTEMAPGGIEPIGRKPWRRNYGIRQTRPPIPTIH